MTKTTTTTKIIQDNQADNSSGTDIGAKKSPCFIPLNLTSQCGHDLVLYYNAHAPAEAIFDCATARLQAVIQLLESLCEFDKAEASALYAVASVSSLLLNDAMTLLHELNPLAQSLTKAHEHNNS